MPALYKMLCHAESTVEAFRDILIFLTCDSVVCSQEFRMSPLPYLPRTIVYRNC